MSDAVIDFIGEQAYIAAVRDLLNDDCFRKYTTALEHLEAAEKAEKKAREAIDTIRGEIDAHRTLASARAGKYAELFGVATILPKAKSVVKIPSVSEINAGEFLARFKPGLSHQAAIDIAAVLSRELRWVKWLVMANENVLAINSGFTLPHVTGIVERLCGPHLAT